jgi:organic hydroperoxide reductase OsmC/OhrA
MSQETTHFYDVEVEWTKEKIGTLTSEGLPLMEVATPVEFGGQAGFWTPEHLYAASVNSCFMSTFLAIANNSKLEFKGFYSKATAKLEKVEGIGLQITEITLRAKVVINQESDLEKTQRILEKAKKNCLVSNSIKTIVSLESKIEIS